MKSKRDSSVDTWVAILLGVFAISLVKSIFENDNSKIVSQKGRRLLSDKEEMKKINKKILISDNENEYQEIFI